MAEITGPSTNVGVDHASVVNDYAELRNRLGLEREGRTVVCTIGSWDILHRGHIEYLGRARELGDILVIGVDSDRGYQLYKNKPVIYPQGDRQQILSAVRHVDYVTIVDDVDLSGEWGMELVKSIHPDVFVCNERSYSVEQRTKLAALCPVQILPFYGHDTTTSSAVISEQMKSIFLIEQRAQVRMRLAAFSVVIAMFALSILTSLSMVVLEAFGKVTLKTGVFYTLILKSTPELFLMTHIVMRYLFPGSADSAARQIWGASAKDTERVG